EFLKRRKKIWLILVSPFYHSRDVLSTAFQGSFICPIYFLKSRRIQYEKKIVSTSQSGRKASAASMRSRLTKKRMRKALNVESLAASLSAHQDRKGRGSITSLSF